MADLKTWNVLSLGGGVQSSYLALHASKDPSYFGDPIDFAVFADTQDESKYVYNWLDWLIPLLAFPVYRVTAGSLSESALAMKTTEDGRKFSKTNIPFFTLNNDGGFGMIPFRGCTADFKIKPIQKFLRAQCGVTRGQKEVSVVSWIGISHDERQRMKDSRDKWSSNFYPLVEKRITRQRCIEWMLDNGYPEPPKSACVYCPFHSNKEWNRIKTQDPEGFAKAIEFEKAIQAAKAESENCRTTPFLHASRTPLETIDFRSDTDRGQGMLSFMDECEGMCGV